MSRTMNHSLSDRAAPTSQEFITQIYKKYDRLILFTAKKYLMDLQECEDAVQESLLKLMSRIELLRTLEEPVLTSYVVTTVRNTAINILRRQKRDAQNITSFTESVEESIIEPDSIIDIIMDREAKRSLREAIDELEPNERLLLEGKYFLGYDDRQLSELLSCAPGSIRMTHHEKLVERYEDALFALMMEDVAETEGEKLQELNEQLKRDPSAEIPRELDERCIRTIRTEFGKKNFISARRGAVRVFRVISAATLIMMLLFTTAFAASPSFRAQTLTALVEMFDDHSEIRFSGTTNGAETHKMSILWMPDGYQIGLEEFDESRMIIRAEGENGENLNVAATSISKSRSYSFDTEGATEEPATVQGNEATVYQMETEDGDKITVLWTDMEKGWIVRVTGYNISKEDMLRISESVEIR